MDQRPGLVAIEAEMARQHADALASFETARAGAAAVATSLNRTGRLLLLGMGGSHWVNRTAAALYRAQGIDVAAEILSEVLVTPPPPAPRTVLVTSQSGASGEVLRYLETPSPQEERFGLTLDAESPLGRALPGLVGSGGPERAFAATRSILVTQALHLAILAALGYPADPALAVLLRAPEACPPRQAALDALRPCSSFVLSGRGALQGLAESGALCLMELARCPALGLEGGQLRHGPMEMLSRQTGVILLRSPGPTAALTAGLAAACLAAEAPVVVLDGSGEAPIDSTVTLPFAPREGMAAVFAMLPALQKLLVDLAATRVDKVGEAVRSSKVTTTL